MNEIDTAMKKLENDLVLSASAVSIGTEETIQTNSSPNNGNINGMRRMSSVANKAFMKENSQALFLRNTSSLKIDQFEAYAPPAEDISPGGISQCCKCVIC